MSEGIEVSLLDLFCAAPHQLREQVGLYSPCTKLRVSSGRRGYGFAAIQKSPKSSSVRLTVGEVGERRREGELDASEGRDAAAKILAVHHAHLKSSGQRNKASPERNASNGWLARRCDEVRRGGSRGDEARIQRVKQLEQNEEEVEEETPK